MCVSGPHVGGGAEERRDAVVGSGQRVGRTCLAVIPVNVFCHVRKVHVHLIDSQQRHLWGQVNWKFIDTTPGLIVIPEQKEDASSK